MKKIIFIIALLIAAFVGVKFFATFGEYSEGTRTGQVTKFSEKGWIWETHEGELLMGGLASNGDGGSTANVFEFSTTNEAVIDTLEQNPGANVTITYKEYFNVNINEGNTSYLVSKVQVNR